MFYSTQILARKGPLGIIWIAAHMDKHLKRSQVAGAHIPGTVDALLDPEAPLALRLSGQLLLGVVRVYSRQLSFLQQDCQDALIRIRLTIRADRQGGATATLLLPGPEPQEGEEGAEPRGTKRGGAARGQKSGAAGRGGAAGLELDAEEWGGLVDLVEAQLMRGAEGLGDGVGGSSQGGEGYAGGLGAAATLVQRRQSSFGVGGSFASPASSQRENSQRKGSLFVEKKGRGGRGKENQGDGLGSRRESNAMQRSQQQPSQSLFGVVSLGGGMDSDERGGGADGPRSKEAAYGGGLAMEEAGDEMFGDREAVIPYDLEDIEVERLRDAPALHPAAAGDLLQGLGMGDVEQQLREDGQHGKGNEGSNKRRKGMGGEGLEGPSGSGDLSGGGTPTAVAVRKAAAAAAAAGGVLLPPGGATGSGERQGGSRRDSRLLGAPDSQDALRRDMTQRRMSNLSNANWSSGGGLLLGGDGPSPPSNAEQRGSGQKGTGTAAGELGSAGQPPVNAAERRAAHLDGLLPEIGGMDAGLQLDLDFGEAMDLDPQQMLPPDADAQPAAAAVSPVGANNADVPPADQAAAAVSPVAAEQAEGDQADAPAAANAPVNASSPKSDGGVAATLAAAAAAAALLPPRHNGNNRKRTVTQREEGEKQRQEQDGKKKSQARMTALMGPKKPASTLLDMPDDDRRDGTLLRAAEFRATLNDRSSLLTQRGLLSNTAAAAQQAGQGRGTRTRRSSQPQRGATEPNNATSHALLLQQLLSSSLVDGSTQLAHHQRNNNQTRDAPATHRGAQSSLLPPSHTLRNTSITAAALSAPALPPNANYYSHELRALYVHALCPPSHAQQHASLADGTPLVGQTGAQNKRGRRGQESGGVGGSAALQAPHVTPAQQAQRENAQRDSAQRVGVQGSVPGTDGAAVQAGDAAVAAAPHTGGHAHAGSPEEGVQMQGGNVTPWVPSAGQGGGASDDSPAGLAAGGTGGVRGTGAVATGGERGADGTATGVNDEAWEGPSPGGLGLASQHTTRPPRMSSWGGGEMGGVPGWRGLGGSANGSPEGMQGMQQGAQKGRQSVGEGLTPFPSSSSGGQPMGVKGPMTQGAKGVLCQLSAAALLMAVHQQPELGSPGDCIATQLWHSQAQTQVWYSQTQPPSQSQPASQTQEDEVQLSQAEMAAASSVAVPLHLLVHGRTRMEASRCFFELLVLQSKGLIRLTPLPPASNQGTKDKPSQAKGAKSAKGKPTQENSSQNIPSLEATLTGAGVAEGVKAGGQRVALALLEMGSQQQ